MSVPIFPRRWLDQLTPRGRRGVLAAEQCARDAERHADAARAAEKAQSSISAELSEGLRHMHEMMRGMAIEAEEMRPIATACRSMGVDVMPKSFRTMSPEIERELRRQCKDPKMLEFFLRPWTEEDEEKSKARHIETTRILAEHKARIEARMADPEITPEDECTPLDPALSAASIADWKRSARKPT